MGARDNEYIFIEELLEKQVNRWMKEFNENI
jgi:hypothetical protein